MAYTKHTWENGETITADKLNNLEDGIAEGGSGGGNITIFPLTYDGENDCYSTTASYNDVLQAMQNGIAFFRVADSNNATMRLITDSFVRGNAYIVLFVENNNQISIGAQNATDPLSSISGGLA